MPDSSDRVELTELDVITRYSLAVRSATADRSELVAALRADLAWLESGRARRAAPARKSAAAAKTAAKAATSTRKPAKKATARRSS